MGNTALHKDFHGAMSYAIQHLDKHYGPKDTEAYLRQLARNVYKPLISQMKKRGLKALEEHWRRTFRIEGGRIRIKRQKEGFTMNVLRCPAIHHMRDHKYMIADRFCETTHIVNDEICKAAGFRASVDYDQENGTCTQRFWKESSK